MVEAERVTEYRTVVLAALLHDVGKLLGHGSFAVLDKGQHPKFSSDFVAAFSETFSQVSNVPLLQELVQRHHESKQYFAPEFLVQEIKDDHARTLAALVSKADNLSRGCSSEQWQDYKETPLASVLERVNRVEEQGVRLKYHARSLCPPASLNVIFPEEFSAYEPGELNRHIKQFGEDFRNLFRNGKATAVDTANFECLTSHLLNLLYKYTWCIPSNTQETVPDVSLYDHLRTTAAIASCLYLYHSRTETLKDGEIRRADVNRFCLVVGDISGIQRYIFDIATIGAGGVARCLRARSLYIQLCTEVATHLILRKLNLLIPIHIIMNSGGRFYLLLPNLAETTQNLKEVQCAVDNWFLQEMNGELSLNLACTEFGDDGFKAGEDGESGFSKVLERVSINLNTRRQNRFAEALCISGQWVEDRFRIDTSYQGKGVCESCRKFPEAEEGLCSHCKLDRDIGSELPGVKYLAFFDSDGGKIPMMGYSVSSVKSMHQNFGQNRPYLVIKLNDPDLAEIAKYPAMSRYLATFVALSDNCEICKEAGTPIATFDCLSQRSEGDKLLGFLKADVDRLGASFVYGLKSEATSVDTIARLSALSRMLDIFFSGWVEHLTTGSGDFYTVFSGGDDLLMVGPWEQILDLAGKIETDFARFTGNPNLTISAGIAIARHDFPISSAAQAADEALKQSKQKERDRVTVLGTTLTWADWAKVKQEWSQLKPLTGQIPSAFLYNLLRFSEMWRKYKDGDTLGLRYHPLLAYSIARNLDPKKRPQLSQWADKILALCPGNKEHELLLDNLGLIASLLIYSKRGG